jgi:hypothetical protein
MIFVMQLLIFVINSATCSTTSLPYELTVKILSYQDQPILHGILRTQKKIEAERKIQFEECQKPGTLIESETHQKSFIEIRDALFPCLTFLRIDKGFYHNAQLKADIEKKVIEKLTYVIPQGIGFFLLPKSLQNNMYDDHIEKNYQNHSLACLLTLICYQYKKVECLNSSPLLSEINQKVYKPTRGTILTFTIPEYILHLDANDNFIFENHHKSQSEQHLLKVFDHVCLLPNIDLTLPAAQSEKNIAGYVYDLLVKKGDPKTLISEQALEKIELARNQQINKPLPEDLLIIKQVVQIFLNPPVTIKEELKNALRFNNAKAPL